METAIRPRKVVRANLAVGLLAPAGGVAAGAYDARLGMLTGACLLGWSQLVGL